MMKKTEQAEGCGLESIPGLGIIRIRSLRKAGWGSLDDLRRATAADLAGVPGISPEKAQWILEFVTQTPVEEKKPAPAPKRVRVSVVESTTSRPAASIVPPEPPAPTAHILPTVSDRLKEIAEKAAALLAPASALDFDRSLARQVGRIAALGDHATLLSDLQGKDVKRAGKQIAEIRAELAKIEQPGKVGGKRQEKLADDLRSHRRKLLALVSEQEPGKE